ncbi:unnamed protein product [Brassica rapa subsp. narinosa]
MDTDDGGGGSDKCRRSVKKTKATVDNDGGSKLRRRSSRKTTNLTATEANKRPIAAQKQATEGKKVKVWCFLFWIGGFK